MSISMAPGPFNYNRFQQLDDLYRSIYEKKEDDKKDLPDFIKKKMKDSGDDEDKDEKSDDEEKSSKKSDDKKSDDKKDKEGCSEEFTAETVMEYLINEGFVNNEVSASVVTQHMSQEWLDHIAELYVGKHGQTDKDYQANRSAAGKRISGDDKSGPGAYTSRMVSKDAPVKPGAKPTTTPKITKSEKEYAQMRYSSNKNNPNLKIGGSKGLPK